MSYMYHLYNTIIASVIRNLVILFYIIPYAHAPTPSRVKNPKNLNMIPATLLDLSFVTIKFNVFRL